MPLRTPPFRYRSSQRYLRSLSRTQLAQGLYRTTSSRELRKLYSSDLPEGNFARGQINAGNSTQKVTSSPSKAPSVPPPRTLHVSQGKRPRNAWYVWLFLKKATMPTALNPAPISKVSQSLSIPPGEVICNDFDGQQINALFNQETTEIIPEDHPTDIPIPDYQNGVIPLESLPGVTAVLYLDFDGEEGPLKASVSMHSLRPT